ncbi:hypothetical protein BJY59DRAFT_491364 [Rhodotorula toruloides]
MRPSASLDPSASPLRLLSILFLGFFLCSTLASAAAIPARREAEEWQACRPRFSGLVQEIRKTGQMTARAEERRTRLLSCGKPLRKASRPTVDSNGSSSRRTKTVCTASRPQHTLRPASTRRLAPPLSLATHSPRSPSAVHPLILSALSARPATNTKMRRKAASCKAPPPASALSSRQCWRGAKAFNWAGRNVHGRQSGVQTGQGGTEGYSTGSSSCGTFPRLLDDTSKTCAHGFPLLRA